MSEAEKNYLEWKKQTRSWTYADDFIEDLKTQIKGMQKKWVSVKDRLPDNETKVIAYFLNSYKKKRTVMAQYVHPRTIRQEDFVCPEFEDWYDYDEEKDIYWTPSGWYEYQEVADINWFLDEDVTHWKPLPDPPEKE